MNLRALLSWGILPWLIACLAALILITVRTLQAHGWPPCELCLRQRVPYWVALPLALGAGVAGLPSLSLNPIFSRLLMLAAGITFLVGAGLAVQHIGVEQGWWLSKCSASGTTNIGDLMNSIGQAPLVACNEKRPFLFGLTLPVYNLLASIALAALSLSVPLRSLRQARAHQPEPLT